MADVPIIATKRSSYGSALGVLGGLTGGIVLGILASTSQSPLLLAVVAGVEPVGTLFINATRMAVVPLVVATLIVGIASVADTRSLAGLGMRALMLFVALAFTAAVFATLVAAPLLARLDIDPLAAERLGRASIGGDAAVAAPQGFTQWLSDLVPANPIKAAADGAMLPLIVFTLWFGVALTRVSAARRSIVVAFFGGLAEAMMVLVGWVIACAPIGVFALASVLAARMGAHAAGALFWYVLLASVLQLVAILILLYPATMFFSGISLSRIVRACAPAQAVALASRSTMASLPAMIEAGRALGLPEPVVAFVIPLAASTLRVGAAVGQTVAVLFAARLFGVPLSSTELAAVLLTTVVTTFTAPGVPGGSIVVMVPILLAAHVPAEAIGLLLGVDVIPDMFRTMANVTGGIAAAAILGGTVSTGRLDPAPLVSLHKQP